MYRNCIFSGGLQAGEKEPGNIGSGLFRDFNMGKDQRKHRRFKTRNELFAAFVMPNEPVIVGRVLDVSSGGAGVQYLGTRKLETGPASIKIFRLNSSHMERVESTVVYDLEVPEEPWDLPNVRRCGIKFEGRGPEIRARLKVLCKIQPRRLNSEQNFSSTSL